MTGARTPSSTERWRKPAIYVAVIAAHVGVLAVVARTAPSPLPPLPTPPFEITLLRPPEPPPPSPPPEPAVEVGGGAPAAPSVVRPAHIPPPEPEVVAPPEPAPQPPETVVGVSPQPGLTAGQGQGGEGTGQGGGTGAGSGPGSGTVRARPIRQATLAELRALHPPAARGRFGRAVVTCQVQLDTRLDGCRVTSETPAGQGFGAAGVEVATRHYRFAPYVRDGREVVGDITVIVEFGRPGR